VAGSGSSAVVGRSIGFSSTACGGSGPSTDAAAVSWPIHLRTMLLHTAQRVVRWMNTVERLPCQSLRGSAARSSSALAKAGSALKLMAISKEEWLSEAAMPGTP
jgi:hypothetical protein